MAERRDWHALGFGGPPKYEIAPAQGLLLYRAWGGTSGELGGGFFSLEKPESVLDAELRFNIVDWGNGVHFVSTFRLNAGTHYLVGPVAQGRRDLSRPGSQVFVEPPVNTKVTLVRSKEVLRHDVAVGPRAGTA